MSPRSPGLASRLTMTIRMRDTYPRKVEAATPGEDWAPWLLLARWEGNCKYCFYIHITTHSNFPLIRVRDAQCNWETQASTRDRRTCYQAMRVTSPIKTIKNVW